MMLAEDHKHQVSVLAKVSIIWARYLSNFKANLSSQMKSIRNFKFLKIT